MPFSNFNPPFTNKTLEDFFDYSSSVQNTAIFMKDWIEKEYPNLTIGLAYHVPFYFLGKEKILYFHYVKNDDTREFEFEISFVKGDLIPDKYHLFSPKNKKTKAILIREYDDGFLDEFRYYIETALTL